MSQDDAFPARYGPPNLCLGSLSAVQQLRHHVHWLRDLTWWGLPCRCDAWLEMARVPSDPLLADVLPWAKPFAWRWAHEELTEALLGGWPEPPHAVGPDMGVA